MMRVHAPVACPACVGARPVPGTAVRISKPGRCCKYSAPRALDEREVQAETASSSEGLQHTVRAGLGEGIVPEPPSTSRRDRHEGLEGRYSAAFGTRGTPEEEAPPAKEREAFWGRLAVLLLGAVLVSERITGKGAVQSLDLAVGVPLWEIEPFLAIIVVGLVYVGLRFPKEAKKLAEGGPERVRMYNENWRSFLQRFACLTLAGTIVAEVATGKGLLSLLQIETGVEALTQYEAAATFLVVLVLTSAEAQQD